MECIYASSIINHQIQSTTDLLGAPGESVCAPYIDRERAESVALLPAFDTKRVFWGKGSMQGMHPVNRLLTVPKIFCIGESQMEEVTDIEPIWHSYPKI